MEKKKVYVKPQIEMVDVRFCECIAGTCGIDISVNSSHTATRRFYGDNDNYGNMTESSWDDSF